ncbi:hypothetical protein M432DRAFT_630303 [Thermoascus aurantiacus ATCC 26904]
MEMLKAEETDAQVSLPLIVVIYISGTGSGIGRVSALQFVVDGVLKLAIVDIASNSLHETTSLIQARSAKVDVQSVIADLSKEDEVQRVFAEIQEHFGRLNVAVNCAGIVGALRPIEQLSSADLDRVLDINLRSVWLCEKAQIEQSMRQEERAVSIVNIASRLGTITMPHASSYVMSKHGVVGLTKTDALDYASRGIRVSAVCPGFVRTNLTDSKGWERLPAPINRLGTGRRDRIRRDLFGRDRASFFTGSSILADGGYTVK